MLRTFIASTAVSALAIVSLPVVAAPSRQTATLRASALPETGPRYPLAALAPVQPVTDCTALARLDLSSETGAATTLKAEAVEQDKGYCRVTGTIAPAIGFEVRLPLRSWTQRFLQTGCGGLCGNVRIDAGKASSCTPVTDGAIVLATTDMGHQGNDLAWGADAQKREDFAERGVHLTALAAKALTRAFYGQAPRYSYFSGCSDGGREALVEAQRHPEDFDGIAAGAPALNFSVQNSFHHAWLAASNTGADGKPILTSADLVPLHNAVIEACDADDGVLDGLLADPRQCRFDPEVVACQGDYLVGECLTGEQVLAVRRIYQGATATTGQKLEPGATMPGSELNWAGVFVPASADKPIFSSMIALGAINNVMFTPNPQPAYTIASWPFTTEMAKRLAPAARLYDANRTDLSGFAARKGKLIVWHGWADPHIAPQSTINWWDKTGAKMGSAARDAMARLFLFPGMAHCSGGEGPSDFPLLAALMSWVETGRAPEVLVARTAVATREGQPTGMGRSGPPSGQSSGQTSGSPSGPSSGPMANRPSRPMAGPPPGAPQGLGGSAQPANALSRTLPVYPYPMVPRFTGTGSPLDARNFSPANPAAPAPIIEWFPG